MEKKEENDENEVSEKEINRFLDYQQNIIDLPPIDLNNKEKSTKSSKVSDLLPLNLKVEKVKFYLINIQYNPQFIYSFANFKFPYAQAHTEYLKCANLPHLLYMQLAIQYPSSIHFIMIMVS